MIKVNPEADLDEILSIIDLATTTFNLDSAKALKGNHSAGVRARRAGSTLTQAFKVYRKLTTQK